MSDNTATIDNQVEETIIPADDDVATPSGSKDVWRIADGHIKTGREADGTERTREKVVGRLRRIGIYHGESKTTGEPYGQLEADIETAEGMTRVKTGITAKGTGALQPSVAALSFAEGLLDMAKDELIVVTANLASKPNKFGNFSTYANLYHLDANKRTKPAARLPKVDKTMDERWDLLAEDLAKHPAFADRPANDKDDAEQPETHLALLCKECSEKGWPTPEQAPSEWLGMLADAWEEKQPKATLTAYSDDQWGQVRLLIKDQTEIPGPLEDAAGRLNPGPAKAPAEAEPFGSTRPAKASAFGAKQDKLAD